MRLLPAAAALPRTALPQPSTDPAAAVWLAANTVVNTDHSLGGSLGDILQQSIQPQT